MNDRDGLTDMTLLHYAAKSAANGMGDLQEACHVINMLIAQGTPSGGDSLPRCGARFGRVTFGNHQSSPNLTVKRS